MKSAKFVMVMLCVVAFFQFLLCALIVSLAQCDQPASLVPTPAETNSFGVLEGSSIVIGDCSCWVKYDPDIGEHVLVFQAGECVSVRCEDFVLEDDQ